MPRCSRSCRDPVVGTLGVERPRRGPFVTRKILRTCRSVRIVLSIMRTAGWLSAAIALVGCSTACSTSSWEDGAHSSVARWNGNITITLPGRLSTSSAGSCSGRSGTPWRDIRDGAPASIRDGRGRVLATWTLPAGAAVPSKGHQASGCRYVLTQSTGIEVGLPAYSLRIASHTLKVPRNNIGGNLFIVLPHRQYTRLVRVHPS